jgi:hypothetical protein
MNMPGNLEHALTAKEADQLIEQTKAVAARRRSAKARGWKGERLFADLLRIPCTIGTCSSSWPDGERRSKAGSKDKGDSTGHRGLCFEVKAWATVHYPDWLRQTEVERVNSGADYGILIVKPQRIARPALFHALMELEQFNSLYALLIKSGVLQHEDTTWAQFTTPRNMRVGTSLVNVNEVRAIDGGLFGAVAYMKVKIPFVAMYAYQMLHLLHLAGYGEESPTEQRSTT